MCAQRGSSKVDEAAFSQLVKDHGDSLLRMCFLYLGDRALAEDAVQDTYLKAYRAMDRFRGESSEKTWLTRIAINTCKNYRRMPWHRLVDRRVTPEELREAGRSDEYDDGVVVQAIRNLSIPYREAVLLYYYQELTVDEIAGVLMITTDAVYARLKRARKKLKQGLERWYCDA